MVARGKRVPTLYEDAAGGQKDSLQKILSGPYPLAGPERLLHGAGSLSGREVHEWQAILWNRMQSTG